MNKFLVKKKGKDGSPVEEKHSFDPFPQSLIPNHPTAPPPPPSSAASQKRGWLRKKPQVEVKPTFDLSSALPSTDNFRTSLLMPNLSARFSMLREQDDPNSIMGKASDDSVLHPKRRSRLGDFGFDNTSALADIDEVSSLKPPRPSNPPRLGSYAYGDDYSTDDDAPYAGSMMTRARPGEGNMLFGGRQKIYRIPVGDSGSVNKLGSSEGRGMRGRALYEDDISLSAFQRLRRKEKEEQQQRGEVTLDLARFSKRDVSLDRQRKSPPSDPAQAERRTSASSSIAGSTIPSNSTGSTVVIPQASSSGTPSPVASTHTNPPIPEKSRSRKLYDQGLDLHLQEQQSAALSRLDSIKRGAPPVPSPRLAHSRSAYNLSERAGKRAGVYTSNVDSSAGQVEPTPPSSRSRSPEVETDTQNANALMQALDPSDRGKATAMGTFSKPKQFSEQQYLQRQLSLVKQQQRQQQQLHKAPMDSHEGNVHNQKNTHQFSDDTKPSSSANSQTESSTSSLNFGDSRNIHEMGTQQRDSFDSIPREHDYSFDQKTSSKCSETGRMPATSDELRRTPPPMFKHPAMRAASQSQAYREKRNAWSPEALASKISETVDDSGSNDYFEFKKKAEADRKDPKLLDESSGLTGLIREHLRHPSNQSSIYPPRSPAPWEQNIPDFDQTLPVRYSTVGPYDSDGLETNPYARDLGIPALNNGGFLDQENELRKQHMRMESSETQYERQAFASELAERQRTIQENLKVKVHNENRAPSPSSNKSGSDGSFMPFGLLRKPSREAANTSSDSGTKTLGKKLGMTATAANPQTGIGKVDDNRSRAISPPSIGRTLHSKMIRPSEEYGRTTPHHASTEGKPPVRSQSEESTRSRTPLSNVSNHQEAKAFPVRTTQPDASHSPTSRRRSSSEVSLEKQSLGQVKGSIDTERSRIDGSSISNLYDGSQRKPASSLDSTWSQSMSSSSIAYPPSTSTSDQAAGNTQSPSLDRINPGSSKPWPPAIEVPYSANSTPPLSAASSPNLDSSRTPSFTPSMLHNAASQRQQQQESAFNAAFKPSPNGAAKSPRRKGTLRKAEISEPTLLASTAKFDTVPLPSGATLMNGMKDDVDVVVLSQGRGLYVEDSALSPSMMKGNSGNAFFMNSSKKSFMKSFGRKPSDQSESDDASSQRSIGSSRKGEVRRTPANSSLMSSPNSTFSHMATGAPL